MSNEISPGSAAARREAELLFSLVRDRYGDRLTPEELEGVRAGVAAMVEAARALRAVPLDNAAGPLLPLLPDVPHRA